MNVKLSNIALRYKNKHLCINIQSFIKQMIILFSHLKITDPKTCYIKK